MDLNLYEYDSTFEFLGKISHLEVLCHTSIVAFKKEFYFGKNGIIICEVN
jgi:hypothetical protein